LETRNSKLETRNSKLETRNSKLGRDFEFSVFVPLIRTVIHTWARPASSGPSHQGHLLVRGAKARVQRVQPLLGGTPGCSVVLPGPTSCSPSATCAYRELIARRRRSSSLSLALFVQRLLPSWRHFFGRAVER